MFKWLSVALCLLIGVHANANATERKTAPSRTIVEFVISNGKVVHQHNTDVLVDPASLTKLMTLRLVFAALKTGKLKIDDEITATKEAVGVSPSKLGFNIGDRISVHDLVGSTSVRSSNDSAYLLAQHIGGNVTNFVGMMNAEAKRLGMKAKFSNPNGLPVKKGQGNKMTGKDAQRLLASILLDYPEYMNYLNVPEWHYKGKTLKTTSHRLPFRDALYVKTGYTKKAGFNIAFYNRDAKIAVVLMGFDTAVKRDRRATELVNRFGKYSTSSTKSSSSSTTPVNDYLVMPVHSG